MCKDVQRQTESATSIIREDKTFHQTERKTFNHTAWRFVSAVSYSLLQGMWISFLRKSLAYWALQSVCITSHCFHKPGGIVPICEVHVKVLSYQLSLTFLFSLLSQTWWHCAHLRLRMSAHSPLSSFCWHTFTLTRLLCCRPGRSVWQSSH